MAEIQEVTVRMSKKLFAKLARFADEAYESPETYIEGALAHLVREVSAAPVDSHSEPPIGGQYL